MTSVCVCDVCVFSWHASAQLVENLNGLAPSNSTISPTPPPCKQPWVDALLSSLKGREATFNRFLVIQFMAVGWVRWNIFGWNIFVFFGFGHWVDDDLFCWKKHQLPPKNIAKTPLAPVLAIGTWLQPCPLKRQATPSCCWDNQMLQPLGAADLSVKGVVDVVGSDVESERQLKNLVSMSSKSLHLVYCSFQVEKVLSQFLTIDKHLQQYVWQVHLCGFHSTVDECLAMHEPMHFWIGTCFYIKLECTSSKQKKSRVSDSMGELT